MARRFETLSGDADQGLPTFQQAFVIFQKCHELTVLLRPGLYVKMKYFSWSGVHRRSHVLLHQNSLCHFQQITVSIHTDWVGVSPFRLSEKNGGTEISR